MASSLRVLSSAALLTAGEFIILHMNRGTKAGLNREEGRVTYGSELEIYLSVSTAMNRMAVPKPVERYVFRLGKRTALSITDVLDVIHIPRNLPVTVLQLIMNRTYRRWQTWQTYFIESGSRHP